MFRRGKLPFVSNKDDRIKIFNERINLTEKHVLEIASNFAECARKLAKYRDSYDDLAKNLKNYADDEEINESLSDGLKNLTNAITIFGDYMDLHVHRVEVKIVNELAQFENLCKNTRDSLRLAVVARDKEVLKQRQMLEIKTKFAANNTAADSELLKSKLEVNRTNKEIDEILTNFEKRKLSDLKATLLNFILISIKCHTKTLEALSASYFDVDNIDEKGDLLEFQKIMKTNEGHNSKKTSLKTRLRSQSMESLDRDQLLSPIKRTSRLSRSTKNLSEKSDDDLDVDDEEDDIEEEASDENSNEDESGSVSEDEEDDNDTESQRSVDKLEAKKETSNKKSNKQHFKVQQTQQKGASNKQKPFAAKSHATKSGGTGRLVTVVESKRK